MRRWTLALLWWGGLIAAGAGAGSLHAQEVAPVQVAGDQVFAVTSAEGIGAAARAQELSDSLAARVASDLPLAPVEVAPTATGAVLVLGADTLARVTPRDAEVVLGRPVAPEEQRAATQQVAERWAAELRASFQEVALRERARVVVDGIPLFEVGGTAELRARRRAAAVGIWIAELARSPETPDVHLADRPGGVDVVAGDQVLLRVSDAEAAARGTDARTLAGDLAEQVLRTVESLREQQTPAYRLRILGIALAAFVAALLLHLFLGRIGRWLGMRIPPDSPRAWGLLPVLAQWSVAVAQFLAWAALIGYVLWLVPRSRPLTFAAAAEGLRFLGRTGDWLLGEGLVILVLVVGTFVIARFAGAVARHLTAALGLRQGGRAQLRADTLTGTVSGATQIVVGFIGLIAVLNQLAVDPLPLLASAGVAGIAIGFGIQTLIRDFFTGMFILLEDQYGVGDLIQLGGVTGKVERFTLRITQVRGLDGSLTSVPNGEITSVTNLSKDWSQVVLDAHIKLGEDVDRAIEVIADAAHELAREWGDRVQGDPEVLGVETVDPAAGAVTIRIVVRTAPLERWAVSRELRRRILDAFSEQNIQVPPRAAITTPGEGAPR